MKEQSIQNSILIAMGQAGAYGLRVNSGSFWGGEILSYKDNMLLLKNPTKVQGAPAGTSDIVGCKPTLITPQMVGKTIGVFVAIEVKKPTKNAEEHQENYLMMMRSRGAITGVAKSPEDVVRILNL